MIQKFQIAIIIFCLLLSFVVNAQTIDQAILQKRWSASWVTVPNESTDGYGVYLFRKTIELNTKPGTFVIHVSADNRYKLFVNEKLVSLGPARGDLSHWNFETVDIAPYLKVGKNILAAQVWNEYSWLTSGSPSVERTFLNGCFRTTRGCPANIWPFIVNQAVGKWWISPAAMGPG